MGAHDRRGFLRGLVSLPLIGGGVTLIGQPTRAAESPTPALLDSYSEWLFFERRLLAEERGHGRSWQAVPVNTGARDYHFPNYPTLWTDLPPPSSRAAVVLAAVGCYWKANP